MSRPPLASSPSLPYSGIHDPTEMRLEGTASPFFACHPGLDSGSPAGANEILKQVRDDTASFCMTPAFRARPYRPDSLREGAAFVVTAPVDTTTHSPPPGTHAARLPLTPCAMRPEQYTDENASLSLDTVAPTSPSGPAREGRDETERQSGLPCKLNGFFIRNR